jgi:hypothetical protein
LSVEQYGPIDYARIKQALAEKLEATYTPGLRLVHTFPNTIIILHAVEWRGYLWLGGFQHEGGYYFGRLYRYDGRTVEKVWDTPHRSSSELTNIHALGVYRDKLYVSEGLLEAPNPTNIYVTSDGVNFALATSLPNRLVLRDFKVYRQKLYCVAGHQIWEFDGSSWTLKFSEPNQNSIGRLTVYKDKLWFGAYGRLYYYDADADAVTQLTAPLLAYSVWGHNAWEELDTLYCGNANAYTSISLMEYRGYGAPQKAADFPKDIRQVYYILPYNGRLYISTSPAILFEFDGEYLKRLIDFGGRGVTGDVDPGNSWFIEWLTAYRGKMIIPVGSYQTETTYLYELMMPHREVRLPNRTRFFTDSADKVEVSSKTIGTGGFTSDPVPSQGYNVSIFLLSSQTGTITVDVSSDGTTWYTYLSESVSANVLYPAILTAGIKLFRIRFTPSASASVTAYYTLSRR